MDTAHSQHLSRISKMLLAAVGVAFAWVFVSLALGFSASQAHAEEDPGLLGSVSGVVEGNGTGATEVVDETAAGVTGVVQTTTAPAEETTAPVAETVAPVVEPIVETVAPGVESVTPIVPVTPVVETVESTVAPVLTTVTDVVEAGVVAPIVDTAVGVVGAIPVVGGVVSTLGVDTAASSVGSGVDGLLQGTAGAVAGTVTDVVGTADGIIANPVVPVRPGLDPAIPGSDGLVAGALPVAAGSLSADAADPLTLFSRAAYLTGAVALSSLADAPAALLSSDGSFVSGAAAEGLLALLRSVLQADSVLLGPGGAGPGAWVLVALGFVVAYRAWMRRSGLENDVAPAAPTLSTDVSPD